MQFSNIFALIAFMVTTVIASPVTSRYSGACLSHDTATTLVGHFISFLEHTSSDLGDANATAYAILDDNYTEISDSILSLEGKPLDTTTFANKAQYIAGTLGGPPATSIDTLEILVAGCTKVLWYWNFHGVGSEAYEVKGFNLFTVTPEGKILATNLEFNSVAWGMDVGFTVTRPPTSGS